MYSIEYTEQALIDIAKLKKDEPKAYQKVNVFIEELKNILKPVPDIPNL